MSEIGVERIRISNSGVMIDGFQVAAMALGSDVHIERFGKDLNGDDLNAVTITVLARNITIGEQLNRGTNVTIRQTH